jgi:DNA processing protein
MHVLPSNWVVLSMASGRVDPWPLIRGLGGAEEVSRASVERLQAEGLPLDLAAQLRRAEDLHSHTAFVLAGEERYPSALRSLPFAPPVLFFEGDLYCLAPGAVAIVGSRRCTAEGRRSAAEIARAVCHAGLTVVSGMAIGIDTAAHREALLHGRTVAVLGQGLDAPQASGARRLRQQIVEGGGAVMSELLPTWPAKGFTFLQRNRVIAGLSRATVVVEAAQRSGALSTARHALAAGREVLAVPGHYANPGAQGCLALIEQGATVVRSPVTVLEAAGAAVLSEAEDARELPPVARVLADALQRGGTVDQLALRAGLSVLEASALLVELELAGLVRRMPGQRYERV